MIDSKLTYWLHLYCDILNNLGTKYVLGKLLFILCKVERLVKLSANK